MPLRVVQRRLHWFDLDGDMLNDLLMHSRAGGQLKTWAVTAKTELEPLSKTRVLGHARWRKGWMKVSSELSSPRTVEPGVSRSNPNECTHKHK